MQKEILRGGLVGCGRVVNRSHMPVWRDIRDVEIVALCDRDEQVAKETLRRFSIPRSYREFNHMLGEEKLDFVEICTPPDTHSHLAIQAMEEGIHVLVEKPMATGLDEADKMLYVAGKHNVKLCVAHNMLYSPVLQKAKSIIKKGDIGAVVGVQIESLDQRNGLLSDQSHWCHRLNGGIFGEFMPHPIYLVSTLLGRIHKVKAIARKFSEFDWVAADHLNVLLEAENGIGSVSMSFNSPRYSFTTRILGTEGQLNLDNCALTITRERFRGVKTYELALDKLTHSLQLLTCTATSSIRALMGRKFYKVGHRSLLREFINSLKNDVAPPVTGEEGRETIRVLESIWRKIGDENTAIKSALSL